MTIATLTRLVALGLFWLAFMGQQVATGQAPAKGRPLSETDLANLADLGIEDEAILARLKKAGIGFEADEAAMKRLKKAGLSEAVLSALKAASAGAGASAEKLPLMLWVTGNNYDVNHLTSEIVINGQNLGKFNTETKQKLDGVIKRGWNDVVITTSPSKPTVDCEGLQFTIGAVRRDEKKGADVMDRPLWSFTNKNGWRFEDGRFIHALGPKTKQAVHAVKLYYAGLEHERTESANEGDYVLECDVNSYDGDPVAATVFVNGAPLNTFFNQQRQIVITDLLKQGRNEIRLVTGAMSNNSKGDYQGFKILGPLEYNVARQTLVGMPVLQFKSMVGWRRDPDSLRLTYVEDPKAQSSEERFTFELDRAPGVDIEAAAAEAATPRLTLLAECGSYDRNHLASEIILNGENLGVFNTDVKRVIEGKLKIGWNDIAIKTAPTHPLVECDGLSFTIGLVRHDVEKGADIIEHKLWTHSSHIGWRFEDGKYLHDFGPKVKEITQTFRLYYDGLANERTSSPEEGDYVLQPSLNSYDRDPVTATLYVNGTPLTTFYNCPREIVVTPLLKSGQNEVRLVTHRIANNSRGDHQHFRIIGPVRYSPKDQKFVGEQVAEFKSMTGWERVEESQQLVYKGQPNVEQSEELFQFTIK